jgi:pyruvate carboxylase
MQCRITTEDPDQNFIPDYGRITAYRGATGFGIRLDGGTAYSGAVITRFYDPLLEKVTAWAPTPEETRKRMDRALREFRIRGVATNLTFLENVIGHPSFIDGSYTTRFVDETPVLFEAVKRQDRATKLLTYIADVTVNGHPETKDRPKPPADAARRRCRPSPAIPSPAPSRSSTSLGPEGFARWMKDADSASWSPTRPCAMATRACLPPACAPSTSVAGASLCARPAGASVTGMLGRGDLRCRHALPDRRPVGAAGRHP